MRDVWLVVMDTLKSVKHTNIHVYNHSCNINNMTMCDMLHATQHVSVCTIFIYHEPCLSQT